MDSEEPGFIDAEVGSNAAIYQAAFDAAQSRPQVMPAVVQLLKALRVSPAQVREIANQLEADEPVSVSSASKEDRHAQE